jgi:hypothetical protein
MDRDQIKPGAYIHGAAHPAMAAVRSRSGDSPQDDHFRNASAADIASRFDGHIERISAVLDKLAELKKAKADHEDFRDLVWRVDVR